ncbi:MAG: cell division protein ZapE [Hyphomicrobiaceae bacterium]|nr:MAG: cell division protein ZapE [Hyphomicrobiaceae bacterium]
MTLLDKYRSLLADRVIAADPAQSAIAASLNGLVRDLRHWRRRTGVAALLRGTQPAPRGLYIFGPVGRGKTMLMDLFFRSTTFRPKRRMHFHEFMAEVHDRIAEARKDTPGDPIPHVARRLAAKSALLCFDEMHVTDIADAMILGRLFSALFENQVVVVATSNVHPSELYKNGLNRQLFLPFIALIEEHMQVQELLAAKDFRLEKLAGKPLYFTPADAHAKSQMDALWAELTGNHPGEELDLDIKGRKVRVPQASMGIARFSFAELCEVPLGALDYLHIARTFHTVMIDHVPVLRPEQRDVARRFVNLIDTLYDARVSLIASAEAEPAGLYPAGDVHFLFERTASRLTEMRSEAYLAGRRDRPNMPVPA